MRTPETDDLALLDRPEVLSRLFYPRKELPEIPILPKAITYFITVDHGVSIGCKFYPAAKDAATILYFHGNGEIASDYEYVAPLYKEKGINLFVADYRGYGLSNGHPTATTLVKDAHAIFYGFITFLEELNYGGEIFIMGRSLGSVPALELVEHYQHQFKGIIIESGFSSTLRFVSYLGLADLFTEIAELRGFGNDDKIKRVSIPLLVIHGEKDRLISIKEGQELYDRAGSHNKKIVIIPGADHNDVMVAGRDIYFREIELFIGKREISG